MITVFINVNTFHVLYDHFVSKAVSIRNKLIIYKIHKSDSPKFPRSRLFWVWSVMEFQERNMQVILWFFLAKL